MSTSKSIKISFLAVTLMIYLLSSTKLHGQNSVSITSNSGAHKIHVNSSKSNFKIEYEGEITLSDDDKDITNISRGGYIEIKKSSFGKRRRLVIENDGGKLVRKFFIGWREKSYYPQGKEWLADVLLEIIRTTTIAAKYRVDRFYKKGGVNAIASELKKIESDYVKTAYLKFLLEKDLNENELVSAINLVGSEISSDHYLTQILKKNQKGFLQSSKTIDAYINASKNVNSDHYLTQIVKSIISNKSISDDQLGNLLKISEQVNSDHYLSQILTEIMKKRELNKGNMNKILTLSKEINSDHYKTQVLNRALKNKNLSRDAYHSFLSTLSDINSDHYATIVIKELLKEELGETHLTKLLTIVKNNVNSDHYATIIYRGLSKNSKLTENQVIEILHSSKDNISSSHYLLQTLLTFAPRVKKSSEKVKTAYSNAAKSIHSDTYYGRAMKAIY